MAMQFVRSPSFVALVQRSSATRILAVVVPPPTNGRSVMVPPTSITHPHYLVGTRHLASKSKKNKGKGGGGGKDFSIKFVFGNNDEHDDEYVVDETIKFSASANLKEIQTRLAEEFGLEKEELDTLEYKDSDGEWKDLSDPSKELAGKKNVPVRFPYDYNEEEDYYDDDGINYDNDNFEGAYGGIGDRVREMVNVLKEEGYTNEGQNRLRAKEGTVVDTKEYVMAAAEKEPDLQNVLVNKIGALDHIVMAIHFPFLWKDDKENAVAKPEEEE